MKHAQERFILYTIAGLVIAGLFFALWTLHRDIERSTQVQVQVANALVQVLAEGLEVDVTQQ